MRSWPFEQSYDEHEIGHLLQAGSDNTIAVLVMHFGVSTFYYLQGRGGLIAQVESEGAADDGGAGAHILAVTDDSWMTSVHAGQDPRAPRMSCQQAFTEVVDARAWDESWMMPKFTPDAPGASSWKRAVVIGPAGMEPWTELVPRDIPLLTEEPFYPVRIESLSKVKPRSWGVVLELRNHLIPGSEQHANNVVFCGYLATVLRVQNDCRATIGIVDGGRIFGPCSVNGVWFERSDFYGEPPEHYLQIELRQGDNLFIMDITGGSHGHGFHFAVDSSEPFEVVSPLANASFDTDAAADVSPFVTIGPFDPGMPLDHQPNQPLDRAHPDYKRAKQIACADDLEPFASWVKPVNNRFVSRDDVFSACVWKRFTEQLPVPYSLQNAVIANPNAAEVPRFQDGDTEMIVDFGRELSGYVEFDLDGSAGTVVDFYGFEYYRDGWRQDTYLLDIRYGIRARKAGKRMRPPFAGGCVI